MQFPPLECPSSCPPSMLLVILPDTTSSLLLCGAFITTRLQASLSFSPVNIFNILPITLLWRLCRTGLIYATCVHFPTGLCERQEGRHCVLFSSALVSQLSAWHRVGSPQHTHAKRTNWEDRIAQVHPPDVPDHRTHSVQ